MTGQLIIPLEKDVDNVAVCVPERHLTARHRTTAATPDHCRANEGPCREALSGTRDVESMLGDDAGLMLGDAGPPLNHHRANISLVFGWVRHWLLCTLARNVIYLYIVYFKCPEQINWMNAFYSSQFVDKDRASLFANNICLFRVDAHKQYRQAKTKGSRPNCLLFRWSSYCYFLSLHGVCVWLIVRIVYDTHYTFYVHQGPIPLRMLKLRIS